MRHTLQKTLINILKILILALALYIMLFLIGNIGFKLINPYYLLVINIFMSSVLYVYIYNSMKNINSKLIFFYYTISFVNLILIFFNYYYQLFNILLTIYFIFNFYYFLKVLIKKQHEQRL